MTPEENSAKVTRMEVASSSAQVSKDPSVTGEGEAQPDTKRPLSRFYVPIALVVLLAAILFSLFIADRLFPKSVSNIIDRQISKPKEEDPLVDIVQEIDPGYEYAIEPAAFVLARSNIRVRLMAVGEKDDKKGKTDGPEPKAAADGSSSITTEQLFSEMKGIHKQVRRGLVIRRTLIVLTVVAVIVLVAVAVTLYFTRFSWLPLLGKDPNAALF